MILASKNSRHIVLLRGLNEQGDKVYHYIAIKSEQFDSFLEVHRSGALYELEDYAVVIESGVGEPSEQIHRLIKDAFALKEKDIKKPDDQVA